MKTKVAVYTRVSTGHEEQLTSMKNQQEYYEKYCIEKGYDLVKVYADEGLSATSTKRKEFLEMLYDAGLSVERNPINGRITFDTSKRIPKFKYIITKDVSRFSRNTNAIDIVRNLREKNVFIIFENAGFTTEADDYELRLNLLLTFSQQESIDRSKKVSFAYKHRAENGVFHMSRPLYGYERCSETKGYLINENEAKLVKEIFHMYVNENMGTKLISSELNKRGLKTREGKNWRADGIKRMIKNEKYKGQVIVNKYTTTGVTGSNRRIERDKGDWHIYDEAIPAIVDNGIWDKAQEIMKARKTTTKFGNQAGSRAIKSIFHHKIKCSKCDSFFVRVATNKKRKNMDKPITEYIYLCRNRRMHGTCDARGISHNVLEREIVKLSKGKINEIMTINLTKEKDLANLSLEILDNKLQNAEIEKNEIELQVNRKKAQIDKFFDSFLDGENNDSILSATKRKIASIEEEIEILSKKLNEFEPFQILKEKEKVEKRIEDIIKISKKQTFSFSETLEMISLIQINEINEKDFKRELIFSVIIPTVSIYALQLRDGFELDNPDINDQYNLIEHTVKIK